MRRALLILGAVVVIVVAVGAWLLSDLSRFIPRIETAASRPLGRAVHIGSLGVRPNLSVEARDVTIANVPGGSRAEMLILPRVTARIGIGGLLGGTVDIRDVTLERPDLLIERDNYRFGPPPAPAGAPSAPSSGSAVKVVLHHVTITDGHLTANGRAFALAEAQATRLANGWDATVAGLSPPPALLAGPLDGQLHIGADATRIVVTRGPQRATLVTAPLAQLQAPADGTRPFDVTFEQPGATAHAKGSAGPAMVDAVFDATSSDLSALSPLLPAGTSTAAGHAHATLVAGKTGTVVLDHLALTGPPGDLAGDLAVSNVGLPSARGTLASKRLDADALIAIARRITAAPPPAPAAPPAPVPAAAPPPTSLPFDRLREAAGDLSLSVDTLRLGGATFRDAHAHATLADGRLALDPVTATTEAGAAKASVHADAVSVPPTVVLMLQAPTLHLASDRLTGTASVRADLNAAGATTPELLASLGGSASAAVVNGEIDNPLAALLTAPITAHLPLALNLTGGTTHVRCAVARAAFAGGVATVAPLALDTARLLATGEGTVDLRARTLSVGLRPVLRAGPGLSIPLLVSGGWQALRIGPDPHPGPIPANDVCAASLAAIGSALPPPEGLPTPIKPPKPADLLRSLLR